MSKSLTGLTATLLLLAAVLIPAPARADFYGMSDWDLLVVGSDGKIGHPADVGINNTPPYILKGFTFIDGNIPAEDLVVGDVTMQTISINPGGHNNPGDVQDWDLNSFLPRSGQSDPKMYVRNWGGSPTWQDTNGDKFDFFLFEVGRNDEFTVQPILPGPNGTEVLGEAIVVPASRWVQSATNEPQIGLTRSGADNTGQRLGGIAFKVTDLKDDKGKALTSNSVILGLVYTSGGMDPSGFFAVGGTPVARNPNPADGLSVSSGCPTLTWSPGTGTVSESVYLSATFADVNSLADAAKRAVASPGSLDICKTGAALTPGVYYWRVLTTNGAATPKPGPIWSFTVLSPVARDPVPVDGGLMVPPVMTLRWGAGAGAVRHTVYLSTSRGDVVNGVSGVIRTDPNYTPATLQASATYYWRVDEFDGTTTTPGEVWSFTTQPATVGGLQGDYFSGDQYLAGDPVLTRMDPQIDFVWSTEPPAPGITQDYFSARWRGEIQIPVTGTYTFVLNSNDGSRIYVDDRLVANDWSTHAFRDTPGTISLEAGAHPIRIEYYQAGASAGITVSWQSDRIPRQVIPTCVLTPVIRPGLVLPAMGAVEVAQNPRLVWVAVSQGSSFDLYLGTDKDAVDKADTTTAGVYQGRVDEAATVAQDLPLNTTIFWRVDEVNGASTTKGYVWSFTTAADRVVDDFENYTDDVTNRIFQTWLDGFGYTEPVGTPGNGTGSMVGNAEPPYTEQAVVHSGRQSLSIAYDNTASPFVAEATRTFGTSQDWSQVKGLSLWVRGRMPVGSFAHDAAAGTYTIGGSGEGVENDATDGFRFVYKKITGNGSITARVTKITRFADGTHAGIMFRETLTPGSIMVMNSIRAAGQAYTISRAMPDASGALGTQVPPFPATLVIPHWLRLTRQGTVFTAEHSSDGQTWEAVGDPAPVSMSQTVFVGMAVAADQADGTQMVNESVFANVTVQGQVDQTGAFTKIEDIGMTANSPAQLYVAVEDSAGKVGKVIHPANDQASQFRDWTSWELLLADIAGQGVNLKAVKKLSVGLGDKAGAGGAGTIYVDDIRLTAAPALQAILTIKGVDSATATGDDGMLQSANGMEVGKMVLGKTTTNFEKYADHPAPHADDFDLRTYASLDDSAVVTTVFAVPVTTVFIIERGGNDDGFIEPLDAAGNPIGAAQAFAKTDWKKPGFKINGQDAGAIVITAQSPIFGIRALPPTGGVIGLDPAVVAGVPAQ